MRRSSSAVIALVLGLVWSAAASAAEGSLPWIQPADNPLLGGWQLLEEVDLEHAGGHCATGMIFEPTQQTVFQGTASSVGGARYFTRNGLIVVPGHNAATESGLVGYRLSDHDHMERRDYLLCTYRRGDPTQRAAVEPTRPGCPSREVLERMQHPAPGERVTYEQAMTVINCM